MKRKRIVTALLSISMLFGLLAAEAEQRHPPLQPHRKARQKHSCPLPQT